MTITATELVAHDILFRAGYIPISTDDKHSVKKAVERGIGTMEKTALILAKEVMTNDDQSVTA